jgi:AraC-like DNA-binding protein
LADELSWLSDVHEVSHALSHSRPIWAAHHGKWRDGPTPPHPTAPHPERHPYCELNLILSGRVVEYVGGEKHVRRKGDLMLLGPGVPHCAKLYEYPLESITVYFLPAFLLEMGPVSDGAVLLSRFTRPGNIRNRIVRPPSVLFRRIRDGMRAMLEEFRENGSGSELKLRSLLMDILVELMRWEDWTPPQQASDDIHVADWNALGRALRYLQQHHTERIYIRDVAKASGYSQSRLQAVFRTALGMSCSQYLMTLRLAHAAAMLTASDARVSEAAFASGFNTLSHFNTSFRRHMGVSPTEYMSGRTAGKGPAGHEDVD